MSPDWRRPNGQTYPEYLETMKAYQHIPSSWDVWLGWQLHWMKHYAHVYGVVDAPLPSLPQP